MASTSAAKTGTQCLLRMVQRITNRKAGPRGNRASESKDKIKIMHARDLKTWTRFPVYREHDGQTLGEYLALREAAKASIWKLRHSVRAQRRLVRAQGRLVRAQDRLAELDIEAPIQYAQHEITLPRSVRSGLIVIALLQPDHPESTIICDDGEVLGHVLRVRRCWRRRTVMARYSCPSRVLNAKQIASLKDTVSGADDEGRADNEARERLADAPALKRLAEAQANRYLHPLLFISHRWDGMDHPDPEGRQLVKLQAL
jgi:hypothetical protein